MDLNVYTFNSITFVVSIIISLIPLNYLHIHRNGSQYQMVDNCTCRILGQ